MATADDVGVDMLRDEVDRVRDSSFLSSVKVDKDEGFGRAWRY